MTDQEVSPLPTILSGFSHNVATSVWTGPLFHHTGLQEVMTLLQVELMTPSYRWRS